MIRRLEDDKQEWIGRNARARREQELKRGRRAACLADTLRELREVEADLRRWAQRCAGDLQTVVDIEHRLGTVELANRAVEREGF